MKAVKSDLREVIEGSKQYVLPLYQRRYSWQRKHWETLRRDLVRLLEGPTRRSHFVGSLVTVPHEHAAEQSVVRYRLIDGQQRLTTILILLCALRDAADACGEGELASEIHGLFLTNQYKKADAEQKLIPTAEDRADYLAVAKRPAVPRPGRIGDAYQYFATQFNAMLPDQLRAAKHAALGRLDVVNITLEHGDDPHLIFESLNAKGERLTQADLLRNYFLMRMPAGEADELYLRYWQPMQQRLGEDLTSFFRHYLMRDPAGAEVRKDAVYDHTKHLIDREAATPAAVVAQLAYIARYAANYARLIAPLTFEQDAALAERIHRLHRLKVTTAYPLLLNVLRAVDDGRLSVRAVGDMLGVVETFLVRRAAVGVPTNQLRVIFRGLCRDAAEAVNDETFLLAIRDALSLSQRVPADPVFRDALARRPLYAGNKHDLTRFLLERIKAASGHKERANATAKNVQLEHVMPQTLTDVWREMIAPGDPMRADEMHEQWLHTLGNLTLTAYNGTLGNQPYPSKRAELANSNFSLNKYFADVEGWTPSEIERRGKVLADAALRLWPDFATPRAAAADRRRRRVPVPTAILIDGVHHPVKSHLDATHRLLEVLHAKDAVACSRAVERSFRGERLGSTPAGMRAPRSVGGRYVDLHGSGDFLTKRAKWLVKAMGLPEDTVRYEYGA